MTFYDWMMTKYLKKDTPRGDLAYDMSREESFPRCDDYDRILGYLHYHRACPGCISIFKRCWRDYQKTVNCDAGANG